MRKTIIGLLLLMQVNLVYSIGITFGPYVNEKELIEHREFPMEYYDLPIFLGGINHKAYFDSSKFIYFDLLFNIHPTIMNIEKDNMANYLIYFHNDYNIFPFNQNTFYCGAGFESIITYRDFYKDSNLPMNYYITTDFYGYDDSGFVLPVGMFEFVFKILFRILPTNDNQYIGNGELALQFNMKWLINIRKT